MHTQSTQSTHYTTTQLGDLIPCKLHVHRTTHGTLQATNKSLVATLSVHVLIGSCSIKRNSTFVSVGKSHNTGHSNWDNNCTGWMVLATHRLSSSLLRMSSLGHTLKRRASNASVIPNVSPNAGRVLCFCSTERCLLLIVLPP